MPDPRPALIAIIALCLCGPPALSQSREDRLALARAHLSQAYLHLEIEADAMTTADLILDDLEAKGHAINNEQRNQIIELFQNVMAEQTRQMLLGFDQIMADYFTYDELQALRYYEQSPRGDAARRRLAMIMGQSSAQILAEATQNFPDMAPQLADILGVDNPDNDATRSETEAEDAEPEPEG